jgi:TolA-binding protein
VTYPQKFIADAIVEHAVPVQIDNTDSSSAALLTRIHHIWTPDVRVLSDAGDELYKFDGFLPPPEFAARLLCAFAMAHLRLRAFDRAEAMYVDVLRTYSTSYAAPEAQYYLGVTRYRRDPESDELLTQWGNLCSRYPYSEYRVKQSFKEMPSSMP